MYRKCLKCNNGLLMYKTTGMWKYDGEEIETEGPCDRCGGSTDVMDIWPMPTETQKAKTEMKEIQKSIPCEVAVATDYVDELIKTEINKSFGNDLEIEDENEPTDE